MKVASLIIAILATVLTVAGVSGQGRINEMGITSAEMAQWFQQHASAQDIARVDNPGDIGLISGLTVGKKMVIFKSVSQISQFLSTSANSLDIVGYNLEPGQSHDPTELANPVAAAQAVKAVAQRYGKQVAIGLTHDLTLQYGPSMAPYADLWVLQIQRAQNDAQMAGEFVSQMVPALTKANPAIKIFVQIRTDSQPAALASLVNGLGNVNVSILTQRQDVQDAINVASQFFGQGGQVSQPANFQPVGMANGSQYGIRVPSKLTGCYAPVASNLIGSTEADHAGRGSPISAWDWSASVGSPVFAICPGTVRRTSSANEGGYGWNVVIDHANGLSTLYAHCLENSFKVKPGQQVTAWTQICTVGRTGMTSWPHVHLNIDVNGKHTPVGQYWDASQVVICHFTKCKASNDPNAPIANAGQIVGQTAQQQTAAVTSRGQQMLQALAALPAEQFGLLIAVLLFALMVIWWLSGLYVRVALISMTAAGLAAGCVAILFMPTQIQATAQAPTQVVVGGDWEKSYEITQGREGWECTNDGAYTMGGVTQITYNRWLAKHGMGKADVCQALTREQAKQIFYELFWLPVGADKMPYALSLTVVDHYYNTGKVSHLLAQCGQDVVCFNNARIADYKTKSNCNLYCNAWIARVNHLRKLTEGNSQS